MMSNNRRKLELNRQGLALLFALALLSVFLAGPTLGSRAQAPDSRPRRTTRVPTLPTATPTPAIVVRRPSSTSSPQHQASSPVNSAAVQGSSPAATPQTTPTPTPEPSGSGVDRITPQLGEPPPPPVLKPKPTPTPTPPEEFGEGEVVKVDTELVNLNVRVIDRNNRPLENVQQEAFHVFEDGVPQPIESFTREEVPISYGLAVDTSASLRSQLQTVIDAAKTIITSNKPGDETFLVRFISSDKIETMQDFTASKDLLIDALDNLYVEGGQTAIIDAVYLSAEHVAEYKKGGDDDRRRRALIVITDGEDRESFYKQEQLFARLREEDVQIYVIGFVNELDKEGGFIRKSPREKAVNLVNRLATESGGRAFFPQSVSELPEIANQIVRDLRTQYVIAYNPTNKERDGSYRTIRVTVDEGSSREKRIALTRNGRLAPKGGATVPKPPPVRITGKPVANTKP
ncbi:MAG TPA: VWA domain-containing protein [Pyrinomonadaceae bacterium]|nr:VWA domain-containing protein [Pyrinomonadaceae bacterium]